MSRELDAAIAEARGYEVEIMDMIDGSEDYVMTGQGLFLQKVPHYSTDGNAMLELYQISLNSGWCVQISAIEDTISVSMFAYSGELPEGNDEKFLVALIGEAKGTKLPDTFARAFYQGKTGKEWQG